MNAVPKAYREAASRSRGPNSRAAALKHTANCRPFRLLSGVPPMGFRVLVMILGVSGFSLLDAVALAAADNQVVSNVLPIIDAHAHLNGDMSAERLAQLMDLAGVRSMVLMARYYQGARDAGGGSDEQALGFARRFPGRFVPFVAGQRGELGGRNRHVWEGSTRIGDDFLRQAERKLQSGFYFGLGEFILRHYAYTNFGIQGGGDVDLPVDSYLMHRLAEVGAKYSVPVLIHMEAEPDKVTAMAKLLDSERGTKFIWAHNCGRSSAQEIREFLTRYPSLMCDLGGMTATRRGGYGRYWPKQTPWIHLIEDGSGKLFPEMKALFEEFPDRFFLGTDAAHTPALDSYVERIIRFRELLSQLRPATAEKLAYGNAQRLFGLK